MEQSIQLMKKDQEEKWNRAWEKEKGRKEERERRTRQM